MNLNEDPSAFQKHLGYHVVRFERGLCEMEMPIAPFLMNRNNIPHGGSYSALLDTAMGFVGLGDGITPRRSLTLNLSVNFMGQAKGTTLIAVGKYTGGGHKTYFADATLHDDTGLLLATANGVFKYTSSQ